MKRKRRISIFGLAAYGLTESKLRTLGSRPVQIEIDIPISPYVYPSPALFRKLLSLSPSDRREKVRQWRIAKHRRLLKELSCEGHKVVMFNRAPIGVLLSVRADALHALRTLRHAESIRIESISGLKPRRDSKEPARMYSVKARFIFQTEGQTHGMQLTEDRIFVLSARSEAEAKRNATKVFRQEGSPSLTMSGHFHRWHFDRILDTCEPIETRFNPMGTEIYYEYHNRRVRRSSQWLTKQPPNQ